MTTIGHATRKENTGKVLPLDEIKDKLDLLDVAQRRLGYNLKRRGSKYQGDHGTVHSSKQNQCLTIYGEQSWHCFHCNTSGDVLNLVGVHEYGPNYSGRGSEFRHVVELAADWAGVQVAQASEAEQDRAEERNRIYSILTEAARWWHQQLIEEYPNILDWVIENYGFTEEFIERKLIGFAPPNDHGLLRKHLLKRGYTEEEIKAASIVNKGNYTRFRGRLTMPYWQSGQVRYFAARQTKLTPNDEHEKAKYQKLKIRDEDNQQISEYIKNDVLLGIDTLRQARKLGRILITEGAPDQLAAEQAGEPCISPVTVRFKDSDIDRLASTVKEISKVYICMDNEVNQAGEQGAIDSAKALEERGVPIYIIHLPRPDGVEKIDVCDFIRDRSKEAFTALYSEALRLPHYMVRHVESKEGADEYIRKIARLARTCRYSAIDQDSLIHLLATRLEIKPGLVKQVFKEASSGSVKSKAQDGQEEAYDVEIPGLNVERFEKTISDPPIYELYLKGCLKPVRLTTEELLDFPSFRNRVFAATNIGILHPISTEKGISKPDTWTIAINQLSKMLVEVEAPEDANADYLIQQKIIEVLTNKERQTDQKEGIFLGKVWTDPETDWRWFKGAELIQGYLKAFIDKPLEAGELWRIFRHMGGASKSRRIGDKVVKCWGMYIEGASSEKTASEKPEANTQA